MKLLKKGLAFLMPIALTVSMLSAVDAQAAKKPKLNKTKLSVSVGKKAKITVKNTKKKSKTTWKISSKKVVKITKKKTKGKAYAVIKGIKQGKATVTAVCKTGKSKKKLKCTLWQ